MANYNKRNIDVIAHHRNVSQEIIEITEDKLKIILQDYLDQLGASKAWITPLSLLITIVTVLLTADFKTSFGVKPEIWTALFICSAIVILIWLIVSLVSFSRVMTISQLIDAAKNNNV